MSTIKAPVKLSKVVYLAVGIIFIILPFHAFLTVWGSTLVGHYTALRLWKEFLLAGLLMAAVYYLYKDKSLRSKFFGSWIVQAIGLFLLLLVLKTISSLLGSDVSSKAAGYGLIVDSRFLIFFLLCIVFAQKTELKKAAVKKWILIPAVVVSSFAILQYLALPYDFLSHFGYGPNTILPYQTINHDTNYIRAISTMRGANPLGAYLVMIISLALSFLLFKSKEPEKRYLIAALIVYVGALIVSFSRSAWIGALLAGSIILWRMIDLRKYARILIPLSIIAATMLLAGLYTFQNNATLDNALLHTNDHSTIERSSNQDHISAFTSSVKDTVHNPLGSGVGSAGPASVYNKQPKISENYFLQITQETGWLGLIVFLLIYIAIAVLLWSQKANPAAHGLFAALVALSFVNLLSHAWSDDTLSYLFFGLSGIVLSPVILKLKDSKNG